MSDTLIERKRALLARMWDRFEGGNLNADECPQCGWHVSSHGLSCYGLDCPGGGWSPAAREGRLPSRLSGRDHGWRDSRNESSH
jgi:hypothetical protein